MEMDIEIQTNKEDIFKKKKLDECLCIQKDETQIKFGSEYIWVWVATIDPENKEILKIDISFELIILIAIAIFISSLINKYGKH